MELGARELMTIGTVICGLAATWGVVRQQITRVLEDLNGIQKELAMLNQRLDLVESTEAVQNNKLDVHATINSVASLDKRARFEASIDSRVYDIERRVSALSAMHNGIHPPVKS